MCIFWLRGQDLNLQPSGYEPDEWLKRALAKVTVIYVERQVLLIKPYGVETVWRQKGEYRTQKCWRYVVSRQIAIEQHTSLLQKPDGSPV